MQSITRSIWLGSAAALAIYAMTAGAEAYPGRPPGTGLTALSTTPLGTQRTPTNAGPVGTGMTVGGMGQRLTPPPIVPIQTPLGGTTSIHATQRLFHNTPYAGPVQGITIYSPLPQYNGTGFATGRLRTNIPASRGIPGPLLTAPPYSFGNPTYPNGQIPNNTTNPPGTTNGTINDNTGGAQYGPSANATRNPATGNETTFGNNSAGEYGRAPNGTTSGAAGHAPGQPNTPSRPIGNTPQAPNGPIQYGWW